MKILFAKQNLQRKKEYKLHTLIYEKNNKKYVRKHIDSKESKKHLQQFINNNKLIKLNSKNILFPKIINQTNNYIDIEYLNFLSLESLIENNLFNQEFTETDKYIKILSVVVDSFDQIKSNPYDNEQFTVLFDSKKIYDLNQNYDCVKMTFLDLNFDNILLNKQNNIYLIDNEWVFNFNISKRFLLFRSIFYLCYKLQSIIATYCSKKFPCYEAIRFFLIPKLWFDIFKFTQYEIEKYLFYESNFQNKILHFYSKFDLTILLKNKRLLVDRYSLNLDRYLINMESERTNLKNEVNKLTTLLYTKTPIRFFLLRQYNKLKCLFYKK